MIKKEMIAMLLAGGQGSRLGVLTSKGARLLRWDILRYLLRWGLPRKMPD